jgi:hypothetical protein
MSDTKAFPPTADRKMSNTTPSKAMSDTAASAMMIIADA